MATYANRVCDRCGLRRPQYDMKQVEKEVRSGRSGSGFSVSLKPTWKSTRVHSGRTHYRKKAVWECAERAAHNDPQFFNRKRENERKKAEAEAAKAAEDARLIKLERSLLSLADALFCQDQLHDKAYKAYKKSDHENQCENRFNREILNDYAIEGVKFDTFQDELISQYRLTTKGSIDTKVNPKKIGSKVASLPQIQLTKKSNIGVRNLVAQKRSYLFSKLSLLIGAPLFFLGLADQEVLEFSISMPRGVVTTLPGLVFLFLWSCSWLLSEKYRKQHRLVWEISIDILNGYIFFVRKHLQSGMQDSPLITERGATNLADSIIGKLGGKLNDTEEASATDFEDAGFSEDEDERYSAEELAKLSLKKISEIFYQRDDFFDLASFVLMSHIASADGNFSGSEKSKILELTEVDTTGGALALEFVKRKSWLSVIQKLLIARYGKDSMALHELLNNLLYVAEADGELRKSEMTAIQKIADGLGIDSADVQKIIENSVLNKKMGATSVSIPNFDEVFDEVFDEMDFDEMDFVDD